MTNPIKLEDLQRKINAAQKLLTQAGPNLATLQSVQTLVKGVHPKIDETLMILTKHLSDWQRVGGGQIVEISAEYLPEGTEPEKERKRIVLLVLRHWKDLKSEVNRVGQELGQNQNQVDSHNQINSWTKIAAGAKGPLGIITLVAVVGVVGYQVWGKGQTPAKNSPSALGLTSGVKIKALVFNGQKIPLDNLYIGTGSDCDAPHYHAKDHVSALALDGSKIFDPGGCGFGKVSQVKIEEVEK